MLTRWWSGLAALILGLLVFGIGAATFALTLEDVGLARGCNQIVSGFPDGTSPATIAAAVTPSSAVQAMWRWDAAMAHFSGWAANGAADLRAVNRLDVLWLCVGASARLQQPDIAGGGSVALRCTATALPVGRDAAVWDVSCTLSGAPASELAFDVTAFSANGRPVCGGALTGGSGTCSARLTVTVDETPGALRFFARTRPGNAAAADLAPEIRPLRRG